MPKTLTTVREKSSRFSFHVSGDGGGELLLWLRAEGVAEGAGESLELGSKLGIDGSEIGVQAQRAALQGSVGH
ncbi:MAG TPA: hypothetical protein VLM85_24695, partial [Polyangiaceae bacterium]|nr:hypothetical protein [Polyangiaceae bacterium]